MTFWFVGTLLLGLYVGVHTTLKPRVISRRPIMYLRFDWLPYVKRNVFHVLGFLCFLNFKR